MDSISNNNNDNKYYYYYRIFFNDAVMKCIIAWTLQTVDYESKSNLFCFAKYVSSKSLIYQIILLNTLRVC